MVSERERIQALELNLEQLKVAQQHKEPRARTHMELTTMLPTGLGRRCYSAGLRVIRSAE
jgi:hypothetical protein